MARPSVTNARLHDTCTDNTKMWISADAYHEDPCIVHRVRIYALYDWPADD